MRSLTILLSTTLLAAATAVIACTTPTREDRTSTATAKVVPTVEDGNPSCASIGLTELLKIEIDGGQDIDGPHPLGGGGSVTISASDGSTFDWSSTVGIDAVIVKGGDAANIYSDANAMSGSGLKSPEKNGGTPELSHVSFCSDGDGGTTSSSGGSSGETTDGGSTSSGGGSSSGEGSSGKTW